MRRHILDGFARAVLLDDESELASFLTYGFAELDFQVRPSRQDLVLALFKALMEVLQELRIPVVVAFDQLEDLLLARRTRRRPSHRRGLLRRHRPGHAPARRHQLPDLRRARPVEPLCARRWTATSRIASTIRSTCPVTAPSRRCVWKRRRPDLVRRIVEARSAAGPGEAARLRRAAAALPVHRGADRPRRPHRADAARHAPAVPPSVRSRRFRPARRDKETTETRRQGDRTQDAHGKPPAGNRNCRPRSNRSSWCKPVGTDARPPTLRAEPRSSVACSAALRLSLSTCGTRSCARPGASWSRKER